MDPVTQITGIAAPLLLDDIDTDALAPTALVTKAEVDYGRALLGGWRYVDATGDVEQAGFVLNRQPFRQARILVAGANFGCGSSREHAVWALAGFGIRSVIAVSFSDIFYDNALKNGLLPVSLPEPTVAAIGRLLEAGGARVLTVDLLSCRITLPDGQSIPFAIDPARRRALLEGLDEIGVTLASTPAIAAFEQAHRARRPWIYDVDFNRPD